MMKFYALPLIVFAVKTGFAASDVCLGDCTTSTGGSKQCTFTVKLDLFAGELGYFAFEECIGTNPTLGELRELRMSSIFSKPEIIY